MNEGILQQVGTPQELYDHPVNRFVAGFIGSPSMNFVDVTAAESDGALTLTSGSGVSIPLPARLAASVRGAADGGLVAGFRPEHIEIGEAAPGDARFEATADVVEYLGNDELLHVNAGGQDIVAIVSSSNRIAPGDVLKLHVPGEKLHVFDGGGLSLVGHGAAAAA